MNKLNIPQITYQDAMEHFGSDKPDLRFHMPLIEAKKLFSGTDFEVFAKMANDDTMVIKALVAKNADQPDKLSKRKIKDLEKYVSQYGAKGLAYFQCKKDNDGRLELKGPLTKFLNYGNLNDIIVECDLDVGDIIFFGAGERNLTLNYMGELRLEIARQLDLIQTNLMIPIWITKFPFFEKTSDGGIKAMHHPFTMPLEESWKDFKDGKIDKLDILTDSYDLVLNGVELGGGSVRIHNQDMQQEIFELMGLTQEDIESKFGFFIEALSYGVPPMAGLALGFSRLLMLLLNKDNIRDVIAFPKAQSAVCPMTDAPNTLDVEKQKELGIRFRS